MKRRPSVKLLFLSKGSRTRGKLAPPPRSSMMAEAGRRTRDATQMLSDLAVHDQCRTVIRYWPKCVLGKICVADDGSVLMPGTFVNVEKRRD